MRKSFRLNITRLVFGSVIVFSAMTEAQQYTSNKIRWRQSESGCTR